MSTDSCTNIFTYVIILEHVIPKCVRNIIVVACWYIFLNSHNIHKIWCGHIRFPNSEFKEFYGSISMETIQLTWALRMCQELFMLTDTAIVTAVMWVGVVIRYQQQQQTTVPCVVLDGKQWHCGFTWEWLKAGKGIQLTSNYSSSK